MDKDQVLQIANKAYPKIREYFGVKKKQFPSLEAHKSIYARLSGEEDMEGEDDPIAEHDPKENKIFFYYPVVKTKEDVIRSLIHEYAHYLQSTSWMKRYYKMGYKYQDHPYELAAIKAEENWWKFV